VLQPDIASNRSARKYAPSEQLRRIAWALGNILFRLTPRPFFALRRCILRIFGATVGLNVHVYSSTRILMPWNVELMDWCAIGEDVLIYSLGRVTIGKRATVSYRSHLCAGSHDLRNPELPLLRPTLNVGDGAWIGTDAFIGPGVTVGEMAVVGARAVVMKDVPAQAIVAGNPARQIGVRNPSV